MADRAPRLAAVLSVALLGACGRSGASAPPLGVAVDRGVLAISVADDGTIYLGGNFTTVGGLPRSGLAALDAHGRVTGWDPSVGGTGSPTVNAIAAVGDRIFVGGEFESVGGVARANLAAVDRQGGILDVTPTVNGPVYALAPLGDAIWVGGMFSSLGGVPRGLLGAFDPAAAGTVVGLDPALSSATTPYDPSAPICPEPGCRAPSVRALSAWNGRMYVGGDFSYSGASPRSAGAAFTAAGELLPWDPGASQYRWAPVVYALAATERGVYVGGSFSWIGGNSRNGVARLDAGTAAASPWDPSSPVNRGTASAYALLVTDRTVYVGGYFYWFGDLDRNSLAAADVATGALRPWNPAPPYTTVRALAAASGRILVGGWGLADYAP